jgi:VIT1/CCC1 family predicted Fe2+/Mn2+ transporter
MPQTPHVERHFTGTATVRDIVIGMSDGLTVPFALAAGLSGAVANNNIVVTAGLAEIAAGSIAMGLGGYLAARSDAEHYRAERLREESEVQEKAAIEAQEVADVFRSYGLTAAEAKPLVDALRKRPEAWVDFMMRFELGLERPDPRRALRSAGTIAGAYVAGGLIPLGPYMLLSAGMALPGSVGVTLIALAVFGYVKGRFTGAPRARSSFQTVLIGGLAAAAAFLIARAIS